MINVFVDQGLFGIVDRAFDSLKLLGEFDAGSTFLDHGDDHSKVSVGALEALDDPWMAMVRHGFLYWVPQKEYPLERIQSYSLTRQNTGPTCQISSGVAPVMF